jgi:hypothetical protein
MARETNPSRRTFTNGLRFLAFPVAAILLPGILLSGGASAGSDKEWSTNVELFGAVRRDRVLGGAEAMLPFGQGANSMTFADLRGWYGDEGTNELSAGLGHRFLTGKAKSLFGF